MKNRSFKMKKKRRRRELIAKSPLRFVLKRLQKMYDEVLEMILRGKRES